MKIWILTPVDGLPDNDNPWIPWYDKSFGFIVRAETEEEARKFAHDEAGYENRGEFSIQPWLDSKYTTCSELTGEGTPGVVMGDFANA